MKRAVLLLFLIVFISSCSSKMYPINIIRNIQNVELGMTKEQVIEIMGKYYILNSNSLNEKGQSEQILAYPLSEFDEFRLKFVNNKLISWDRFNLRENTFLHKKLEE